jgi:hypothetical protein
VTTKALFDPPFLCELVANFLKCKKHSPRPGRNGMRRQAVSEASARVALVHRVRPPGVQGGRSCSSRGGRCPGRAAGARPPAVVVAARAEDPALEVEVLRHQPDADEDRHGEDAEAGRGGRARREPRAEEGGAALRVEGCGARGRQNTRKSRSRSATGSAPAHPTSRGGGGLVVGGDLEVLPGDV